MPTGLLGTYFPGEDPMAPVDLMPRGLLGPSVLGRMQAHGGRQRQRMAAGDYSPTPMDEESMWLADDLAGGILGSLPGGVMGAIKAYHGSPHRFDRFDMSKIGTGEGAQAYGSGLYFAESPDVARSYRDALARTISSNDPATIATAQAQTRGGRQEAIDFIERQFAAERAKPNPDEEWIGSYQPALDYLKSDQPLRESAGALYTTRLDVEPEDLLDYDAPLPQIVRDIISERLRDRDLGDEGVKAFWKNAGDTGDAYVKAERFLGPGSLIEAMKEAGYKGIRYLDQQSRYIPSNLPDNPIANEARQFLDAASGDVDTALKAFNDSNPVQRFASDERDEVRKVIKAAGRQATRNFVIFDDKLIDIEGVE